MGYSRSWQGHDRGFSTPTSSIPPPCGIFFAARSHGFVPREMERRHHRDDRALLRNEPHRDHAVLERTRDLMNWHTRDCLSPAMRRSSLRFPCPMKTIVTFSRRRSSAAAT